MCLLVVLSGPISLYCSGPYGLFTLPTFPLLCLFVLFLFPAYLKEERKRWLGKGQAKQRECWKKRPCTRLTRDFDSRVDGQPSSSFSLSLSNTKGHRDKEEEGCRLANLNKSLVRRASLIFSLLEGIKEKNKGWALYDNKTLTKPASLKL